MSKNASACRDLVNHPPHYTSSKIEPIDVIEAWGLGYHLGCVIKYLARAKHKGTPQLDYRKASWYLNRHIEATSGQDVPDDCAACAACGGTGAVMVSVTHYGTEGGVIRDLSRHDAVCPVCRPEEYDNV